MSPRVTACGWKAGSFVTRQKTRSGDPDLYTWGAGGSEVLAAVLGQVMAGEAEPGPRAGPDAGI